MALSSPRFKDNKQLQKAAANSPPLVAGDTGEGIRLVQQALNDLGYKLPTSYKRYGSPDGIYGRETIGCIKQLQSKYLLTADGVAGKNTLAKLDELLPTSGAPLKPLPAAGKFNFRIRLHLRSINLPAVSEYTQLASAQAVYRQYGIDVVMASGKSLLLDDDQQVKLNVIDGECLWDQESDEQGILFELGGREGVGPTDILVYFANDLQKVRGGHLRGCAGHKPGRPAVMLAADAKKYDMAHEVGHVLLGSSFTPVHTSDPTNVMVDVPGEPATPLTFTPEQLTQIRKSPYCVGA